MPSSLYFLAPAIALLFTKIGKMWSSYNLTHTWDWNRLVTSGGMPSDHSAVVCSLATIVGLINGVSDPSFAIAAVMAGIVMYDSVNVRLSTGTQGDALKALIAETKSGIRLDRIAYGHKISEMVIGSLIGVLAGLAVFYLL